MVIKSSTSAASSESFTKSKSSSPSSSAIPSIKLSSMNSVFEQIKQADKKLDTILSKQALALKLERKSGIKKTQMVYGLAALLGVFVLYRFATNFVISVVLLAYPLILSLEAVEGHDKTKDAHILSYWSIIAIIQLTESIFPFVRRAVPFYNLLKLALAVYLYLPQTKGSLIVYDMGIKPILTKMKAAQKSGSKANNSVPLKKSNSDTAEN